MDDGFLATLQELRALIRSDEHLDCGHPTPTQPSAQSLVKLVNVAPDMALLVIQDHLKISGPWWNQSNAGKMLGLRTLRANGDWHAYWSRLEEKQVA
jgi:hypothetical protein